MRLLSLNVIYIFEVRSMSFCNLLKPPNEIKQTAILRYFEIIGDISMNQGKTILG